MSRYDYEISKQPELSDVPFEENQAMNKEQTAAELDLIQAQLNQTSFDKNYKDAVMSGVKIGLDRGWNAAIEHARKDNDELRQAAEALLDAIEGEDFNSDKSALRDKAERLEAALEETK